MKRLPNGIPLFFALILLVGCGAEPEAQPDQEEMAAETAAAQPAESPAAAAETPASPTPPPPDTTIEISREGDEIVVPDSVGVHRGRVVSWAAADSGAIWMVLFADSTPMQNGVHVLHNVGPGNPHQGPIRMQVDTGSVFKYWVFYPDGQGGYLDKDPRLVIVDDPN